MNKNEFIEEIKNLNIKIDENIKLAYLSQMQKQKEKTNYEYEFRHQQDSNTYRKSNPG